MMKRLMSSRGMKKFRKNRLAVFALGVIGLFGLVFLSIISMEIYDVVTVRLGGEARFTLREGTRIRVLPRKNLGFLESQSRDEQIDDLGWHHARIGRIFDRDLEELEDPWVQAFNELKMAERKVTRTSLEEVGAAWEIFDEKYEIVGETYDILDEVQGLIEFTREDLDKARAEDASSEKITGFEEELVEFAAELEQEKTNYDEQYKDAKAALEVIMPMPKGWDGFKYGFRTFLGSDVSGRSISCQAFYSIKVAFQIGFVVAGFSVLIGTILGAAAAFYGGWIDAIVMWLVTTLSSVPYLVLLVVLAYMFTGNKWFDNPRQYPELQLVKLYAAMGLAFWIGTCRVIRGEVMKIKELEYVQAATAIGFGKVYILIRHVIPNTAHIMFINFSLLFIGAIKSEVILSFLGMGVSGQPSWGTMISLAKDDLTNYFFWQILSASVLLFVLVLAFNIVSDALQDAFDPRHVS